MINFSRFFYLWIGAGALAWASYASDEIRFAQALLAAALLWTFGLLQRWKRISLLGAILFSLTAVAGLYRELPFGWMLAGALGAYLAYDLSKFSLRIRYTALREDTALIMRVHLTRVALMTLLGLSLSTAVLIWQNQLDLSWGIFLGIVFLWWMGVMIIWRR